jgi:toxin ParE1/3/4
MVQINWTIRAKEDIKSIAIYISQDSVYYAEKQVERFYAAVEVLFEHPLIGKPITEYNSPQLRQILVGKYRIIYLVVSEDRIDIITIHHSARLLNLESLF